MSCEIPLLVEMKSGFIKNPEFPEGFPPIPFLSPVFAHNISAVFDPALVRSGLLEKIKNVSKYSFMITIVPSSGLSNDWRHQYLKQHKVHSVLKTLPFSDIPLLDPCFSQLAFKTISEGFIEVAEHYRVDVDLSPFKCMV